MKAHLHSLLLHPSSLSSLFLLLWNDLYLKYEYTNWITGKLSDFAGLFVFTIFLVSLFPRWRGIMIGCSALFFCWWKSPLSDGCIEALNYLAVPVRRTADCTDLFALGVLPFVTLIRPPVLRGTLLRSAAVYITGAVCLFSFCFTSIHRKLMYHYPRENEVRFDEYFISELSPTEVLRRMDPENRGYTIDSVRFYRVHESESLYHRFIGGDDSTMAWVPVANNTDSALYIRKESSSFFIMPQYVLEQDTLYNLEFQISSTGHRKKQTQVRIETFTAKNRSDYLALSGGKKRRLARKHFRSLLEK